MYGYLEYFCYTKRKTTKTSSSNREQGKVEIRPNYLTAIAFQPLH
jgi:hypothetical protein